MATEPPAPKTHFHMSPAKPKGTLADYDAGNLPPPSQPKEATVAIGKRGSRPPRRRPNAPKIGQHLPAGEPDTSDIPAQGEEFFANATLKSQPSPYEQVLGDLEFKRRQIDAAIAALKELYE